MTVRRQTAAVAHQMQQCIDLLALSDPSGSPTAPAACHLTLAHRLKSVPQPPGWGRSRGVG